MGHGHNHGALTAESLDARLLWATVLNVVITLGEALAGLFAGSLALLADALHNLSDVGALVLALVARRIGRRPPSPKHTYGLKRLEVLSAVLNAVVLLAVTGVIAREAFVRLLHPQPVKAGLMFWAALLALLANLASVFLLRKHDQGDLNMKSALLHLLQDALASLAVLAAALFAHTRVGIYLDPIASLVVGFAVLYGAISILVDSFSIVSEGVPKGLELDQVVDNVDAEFPGARMHHVHLWEVGPGERMLTAHVGVADMSVAASEELFARIRAYLKKEWAIGHVTLEPESGACKDPGACDPPDPTQL